MKKHVMFDFYGANQHQLDDIKHVNDLLTRLCFSLDLQPICPPQLIPYYYGKVKEDIGVSAFILLEGGHVTIHTFPLRECYFVDIFAETDFDDNAAYQFFLKELPFDEKNSIKNVKDRSIRKFEMLPYESDVDFGPHVMTEIKAHTIPTMEVLFDFLEKIVYEINMDPITRPFVLKSRINNPKYLSAIIVIAQSHIAIHYNYKTKFMYADIFSCAPFDYTNIDKIYAPLGEVVSNELTARGSKHIYKVKSKVSKSDLRANMRWQKAIKK